MEFDFLVRPGADPGRIRMDFEGAVSAEIDAGGDLVLRKDEHELRHRKPAVYQTVSGRRAEIEGRYNLEEDGTVTFRLSDYDADLDLVIDPLIEWQVTIGGSGDEQFNAVAIGPDGTIHVAGATESTDIPVMNGSQSVNQGGPADAYVATLRPDGTIINATFLGGSGRDVASDIVVDPNGVPSVIGTTNSPNFPTTDGAFQPSFGGGPGDAFVTTFSPDGSDIVGSTFLGGPGRELGTAIAYDGQGRLIITGATFDFENGFPVTPGAFQTDFMGEADGFVSKIDSLASRLVASTLFGGTDFDIPVDIVIDADGNPYIIGETTSTDLPLTDNAFQTQPGGGVDVFLVALSRGLDASVFSTYIGGPGDDRPHGADIDFFPHGFPLFVPLSVAQNMGHHRERGGSVWIGGSTTGGLPTTPNAPNPDFNGGPTDGFLARIPSFAEGSFTLPNIFFNEPLVTYTGDGNQNAVLDVEVVNDHGRMIGIISESNFSEDPSPVEGCGDEPRVGVTGRINCFDPTTGMFIRVALGTPDQNCIPGGVILDLDADPFFDFGKVFGSGFLFTVNGSDGAVIQIDTDAVFESAAGADLELKKSRLFKDRKAIPEALQVFVLTVRNKGPDTASNVQVTDSLPPGFTVEGIQSFGGSCTQAGKEIMCDLGAMAPDTSKTIKIRGRVPAETGDYINIAIATADNLIGPTRSARADLEVRPFVPLAFSMTVVSSDSSRVEYRIEVRNVSATEDATNVKIVDTLPPEIFGVEFETSKGKCNLNAASPFVATAQSTLNCTLDVLPAGDTWVIRVQGRPKDLRAQIFSSATVDADQAGTFDYDSATFLKTDGAAAADLQLSLWFIGATDQAAATMCKSMRAKVFNHGLDAAAGVKVEIDQISAANVRTIDPLCSASGTRLLCNIGGLAALSSRDMGFTVCAVNEPENARFRGVVTAITADPDPTNDVDSAAAVLDPSVENVQVSPGGVISSSGFHRSLLLSAGSDPSLFGEGFGDEVIVADTVPLPLELGGVSVELNGIPAPLIFVSPNQINFQTPWELQADTKATVVVRNNGDESLPAKVFIVPFNPGIFTTTQTGSGQAAVLIAGTASVAAAEGSIPGAATRPVKIGEFISIFATGLGAVNNRPETGAATSTTTLSRTKTNPVVTIGGVEAGLTFSGLAPGFVGLYQVNAQVAAGTPTGDAVELVLSSGRVPSNTVTIAVAP